MYIGIDGRLHRKYDDMRGAHNKRMNAIIGVNRSFDGALSAKSGKSSPGMFASNSQNFTATSQIQLQRSANAIRSPSNNYLDTSHSSAHSGGYYYDPSGR